MLAFTLQAARCPPVVLAVVRSLLEFESSIFYCSALRSTHYRPPRAAAVVFVLVWFPILHRYIYIYMLRYVQTLDSLYSIVLLLLFPTKSIATTRICRLFGPWAVRAVVYGEV